MVTKLMQHPEGIQNAPEVAGIKSASPSLHKKLSLEKLGEVEGYIIRFNHEQNLPFTKESILKLSVFVDRKTGEAYLEMKRLPGDGRAAFTDLHFSDSHGNRYKYLHVKGLGLKAEEPKTFFNGGALLGDVVDSPVRGMLDVTDAKEDWKNTMKLLENGVRTAVPVAIIGLRTVILADGRRVSVEEQKKEGELPYRAGGHEAPRHNFTPVLYIRGFSEVVRVVGADKEDFRNFANAHDMSLGEYAEWWMKATAKNLARMHDMGKAHTNLLPGNVTIDGCIVDTDTVRDYNDKEEMIGPFNVDGLSINKAIRNLSEVLIGGKEASEKKTGEWRKLFWAEYLKDRKDVSIEEGRLIRSYFEDRGPVPKEIRNAIDSVYRKKRPDQFEYYKTGFFIMMG